MLKNILKRNRNILKRNRVCAHMRYEYCCCMRTIDSFLEREMISHTNKRKKSSLFSLRVSSLLHERPMWCRLYMGRAPHLRTLFQFTVAQPTLRTLQFYFISQYDFSSNFSTNYFETQAMWKVFESLLARLILSFFLGGREPNLIT